MALHLVLIGLVAKHRAGARADRDLPANCLDASAERIVDRRRRLESERAGITQAGLMEAAARRRA